MAPVPTPSRRAGLRQLPLKLRPRLDRLVRQEARRLTDQGAIAVSRQAAVISILERYFRETAEAKGESHVRAKRPARRLRRP